MRSIKCENGCCKLLYTEKLVEDDLGVLLAKGDVSKSSTVKTGVYLYDVKTGKILLSQSYNDCWGIPKGTKILSDPDYTASATRELCEETGIEIDPSRLTKKTIIRIHGCEHIIYLLGVKGLLKVRNPDFNNNESTGAGWIKPECVDNINIKINRITHLLLQKCRIKY